MLVGDYELVQNCPKEQREENFRANVDRDIPHFKTEKTAREGAIVIVGGGPSLAGCLDEIRARQAAGQPVWTVNNTYSFLKANGIQPDAHVFLDSRPQNTEFATADPETTYYLDVRCDPSLYEKTEGCMRVMYTLDYMTTGHTVGLKAMCLAAMSGWREIVLYGFDSSYSNGKHHAYEQPLNDAENRCVITTHDGREFLTAPWMANQADEFQELATGLAAQGCSISVAGDGLLPHVARLMLQPPGNLACYDLAKAPASYDFLTWLLIAEMNRRERGFEGPLRVAFRAGPKDGFRDDNLPMDAAARRRMFEGVVRPALALIGAVEDDAALAGCEYQYMTRDLSAAARAGVSIPLLAPTEFDLQRVDRVVGERRPVVIVLREATHWPARNSNLQAWLDFAKTLDDVIFVRDTERAHEPLPFETSPEASIDLGFRMALFARSRVVMGISSGPLTMCAYSSVPCLSFRQLVPDYVAGTPEWWAENLGVPVGEQFPWARADQRLTWCDDTLENIQRHYAELQTGVPPAITNLPTNTPAAVMIEQSRANLERDLPVFMQMTPHRGHAVIVGGGPSLAESLPKLQFLRKRGALVFALNGTHDWLLEHGIKPDYLVIADARADNVRFVQNPVKSITYLIAAQCHPGVFEALRGFDVIIWCPHVDGIEPVLEGCGKPVIGIGGGATVGLKTMSIAHLWGFRALHLFGFDSSYRGGANHAYRQDMNAAESVIDVEMNGRHFRASPAMIQQAKGFEQQSALMRGQGSTIKVYGDGLIPWIHQQMEAA